MRRTRYPILKKYKIILNTVAWKSGKEFSTQKFDALESLLACQTGRGIFLSYKEIARIQYQTLTRKIIIQVLKHKMVKYHLPLPRQTKMKRMLTPNAC